MKEYFFTGFAVGLVAVLVLILIFGICINQIFI